MIEYILDGHGLANEVQTMIQVFYPNTGYKPAENLSPAAVTVLSRIGEGFAYALVYDMGILKSQKKVKIKNNSLAEKKRSMKLSIYGALSEITGIRPPWGLLTGIRPAKIANALLDEGKDAKYAVSFLRDIYLAEESKAGLAVNVAAAEREILKGNTERDMSIYIGIPFCPSRCLYCSFTSYPLAKYEKSVDTYIDCVIKELDTVSAYAEDKLLKTVYIGGGTPTVLSERQLERLIGALRDRFDFSGVLEFTVEGGRPETLTSEKLKTLKDGGVSRLSINPQTMNEKTLRLIGRNHSPDDIKEAFFMARQEGFFNINTDIILGLPGEGPAEVLHTLDEIRELSPENLTVHTLAVKRASKLKEELGEYTLAGAKLMENMLDVSAKAAYSMGMSPYYMYRQKNSIGNFENVGYSKPGCFCMYNVLIMEETQNIIAAGAGAVSKTVDLKTGKIERIFNVKSVDDYISRIDEMIERKKRGLNI